MFKERRKMISITFFELRRVCFFLFYPMLLFGIFSEYFFTQAEAQSNSKIYSSSKKQSEEKKLNQNVLAHNIQNHEHKMILKNES